MKKIQTKEEVIQYADQEFTRVREVYNEVQQLVIAEEFTSKGELVERITYEYREDGLLLTETFEKEDGVYQTYHFSYDDEGKITEMIINYAQGGKETHQYTRENGVEELLVKNAEGRIERKELRKFNDDEKLIFLQVTDEDRTVVEEEDLEYDDEGRLVRKTWHNGLNEGVHTFTYEIDEDGDLVKNTYDAEVNQLISIETTIDKGDVQETITEVLDQYTILHQVDENNRTETIEVEDLNEELMESQHTEFDEDGNPMKTELFDVRGLGKTITGSSSDTMVKLYNYSYFTQEAESVS